MSPFRINPCKEKGDAQNPPTSLCFCQPCHSCLTAVGPGLILPPASWRACKLKSMFQSRSCYPSYSSTQETSCGIRTFHDHQLPPGSHREEIQGWKVAALLGTQASALILQHKATSTHQFGFLGPKVTHIKKIVYELCICQQ